MPNNKKKNQDAIAHSIQGQVVCIYIRDLNNEGWMYTLMYTLMMMMMMMMAPNIKHNVMHLEHTDEINRQRSIDRLSTSGCTLI